MVLNVVHVGVPTEGLSNLSADVIAVHGLGGDAQRTWTNIKTQKFWLKDYLPQDLPGARIMTFGYNAAAALGRSTADINDHAKDLLSSLVDKRDRTEEAGRPIIFIAHSLGGIVVKQALFQASIEERYKSISDSTIGIIFFGTPHRGSDKATYGKVLANVANTVLHQPSSRLLSALQTNSDTLMRLTSDFRFKLPQYHVASFYEQRPMKLFSSLIVEKHSALLDVAGEEQIPVDANHEDMCKFEGPDDAVYEKLYKRLGRMMKVGNETRPEANTYRNKHFEVSHILSSLFTGRNDICERLEQRCLPPYKDRGQQVRFVLYGLGGAGKTQICLKFTQDHRERFWGIFWVDMTSVESAESSFSLIARALEVKPDINSIKRWLSNTTHEWLLVLDNADNPDLKLPTYFPAGNRGTIIITSRNVNCRVHATVGYDEVDKMTVNEAVTLLLRSAAATDVFDPKSRDRATLVVKTLGYLALAIVQAGAVIGQNLCSMEEYCDLYHRHWRRLFSHGSHQATTDYRYTVFSTWEISLDMIKNTQTEAAANALKLLPLFCFFHHDGIPELILQEAWKNRCTSGCLHESCHYLPTILQNDRDDSLNNFVLRQATMLLCSFSLLKRDVEQRISLHPLVHDWGRERLERAERESFCLQAGSVLAHSISPRFRQDDFLLRRLLVPHIDSFLQFHVDTYGSRYGEEKYHYEVELFALAYSEDGRIQKAVQLSEQVLAVRKRTQGEEHPDTLGSMNNLSLGYSEAGRRQEALELLEQVFSMRKRTLGEEHPDTLSSMNNLSIGYSEAGRRQEALELSEQVLAIRKRTLGEEHPDTLGSINNLSIGYSEAGRRQEALELSEQVLAIRKRTLGEEHPDTLDSMNNLSIGYSKAGCRQEALELSEQVLAIRKRTLGEEHPDTLGSINNLSIGYSEAGRRQEALELSEQVLAIRKRTLGEEHPDTLRSMNNLSIGYSEAGRRQEALELSEQVLALMKRTLGNQYPDMVWAMQHKRSLVRHQ